MQLAIEAWLAAAPAASPLAELRLHGSKRKGKRHCRPYRPLPSRCAHSRTLRAPTSAPAAVNIPVIGFNAVRQSEHFASFFVFGVLHAALAIQVGVGALWRRRWWGGGGGWMGVGWLFV